MKEFELYRHDNGDGTSKDWAIRINGDGTYTTRWGKTGPRLAQMKVSDLRGSHVSDVDDLKRSKERKGYRLIGAVLIDDGGSVFRKDAVPERPDIPGPEAIYWRIRCAGDPAESGDASFSGFQLRAVEAARKLADLQPLNQWRQVVGLQEFGMPANASGQIRKEHGIAPLLFLMALKRIAPAGVRLSIASEDAVEIGPDLKLETRALEFFGATLDSVREAAEELRILERRIDLSQIETDWPDFSF